MSSKTASWALRALVAATIALVLRDAQAHPHIKRWAFEGTLLEIDDADQLFGPLVVGHPVYGTLSYDVTTSILEENEWGAGEFETIYNQPEEFPLVTLATENLATNTVTTYVPYLSGYMAAWDNITEWSGPDAVEDLLLFEQDFYAPGTTNWTGFTSQVQFLAPHTRFAPPPRLPPSLDLDDWRSATVTLTKLSGPFSYDAVITAEIHTLTPIEVPFVAGDFTGDAVVDARDLAAWKHVAPSVGVDLAADANDDGRVDGADFLIWQRQLGVSPRVQAHSPVPEPESTLLAAACAFVTSRHPLRRSRVVR